jgi:transposase-like protein
LKVLQKDVPQVIEILIDISETPLTGELGDEIFCPSCSSTNINTGHISVTGLKGVLLAFFGFLTITLPPFFKTRYYCLDCEHVFNRTKEKF